LDNSKKNKIWWWPMFGRLILKIFRTAKLCHWTRTNECI
jgi:hypothetical protein